MVRYAARPTQWPSMLSWMFMVRNLNPNWASIPDWDKKSAIGREGVKSRGPQAPGADTNPKAIIIRESIAERLPWG